MDLTSFMPELVALGQVILIDLVLAGDNAIVVGMAAAGLPKKDRGRVILIGIAAATVLRIMFALVTNQLLLIIGLTFAGGLLLLWVCWKFWRELMHQRRERLREAAKARKELTRDQRVELSEPQEALPGAAPLLRLERSAVPVFGVHGYGVHMNGFVRDGGRIRLWVGKRAANRPIEPGKLDHLVAGGIPLGMGAAECLIKEGEEEASIPAALMAQARPVGAIRYRMEHQGWLRNDTMFVYDLELPADFTPVNADGEIASFELMELDQVRAILARGQEFKFNVALVLIDFLIRHGHIAPDETDYSELAQGLWRD